MYVNEDTGPPKRVDCEITHPLEKGMNSFTYRNFALIELLHIVLKSVPKQYELVTTC